MTLPYGITGSLSPAFASARHIRLAVKHPLYLYAQRLIAKQPERTFASLRYNLGGDRPSQTTRLAVSRTRMTGLG